jgi:hypothetical protein
MFVLAIGLLLYAVCVLHEAQKLRHAARENFIWRRVPADVRIATMALAVERALFATGDTSETAAFASGMTVRNLLLVLRWAQSPLYVTSVENVAGVD